MKRTPGRQDLKANTSHIRNKDLCTVNTTESNCSDLDKIECLSRETSPANLQNAKTTTVHKKKKTHKFNERDTRLLIAAVEVRPVLWATNGPFKTSKKDAWEEVFKELNIKELESATDLKRKWNGLRYAFKQHSEKLRTEKVGHGASLSHEVSWEYFKQLLFLYDAEDDGDAEEVEEESFTNMEPEIEILGSPAPTKTDIHGSQQSYRENIHTSPPSIRVSSRKQLQCLESNTQLCNHILAELRLLPAARSRHLRRLLIAKMYDFIESKI